MKPRRPYYTPSSLAAELGVNVRSVYNWVRWGWLRVDRYSDRTMRIRAEEVDRRRAGRRTAA